MSTPGPEAAVRQRWPAGTAIGTSPGRPTLVLFAHPRCPCTRASLTELRALVSRFGDRVTTYVVFLQPGDAPEKWARTGTWQDATSMHGVHVLADVGGREAARFDAKTSGHVVLYDRRGDLLFAGGITPARGHAGTSAQLQRLVALLDEETREGDRVATVSGPRSAGPIYGCSLGEAEDGSR